MIIATDTTDGNQYKIGKRMLKQEMDEDQPLLISDGDAVQTRRGMMGNDFRHLLTLLPDGHLEVLYRKLGKALYESMSEEAQSLSIGEYRTGLRNEYVFDMFRDAPGIRQLTGYTTIRYPILRAEASPKPKSAEDYLADILAARATFASVSGKKQLDDALDAAEQYKATKPSAE